MTTTNQHDAELKIVYVDPKELKPSDYSKRLYDDEPGESYLRLVQENGIKDPVHSLTNKTLIGGRWRHYAALKLGLKLIACIFHPELDGRR